MCEPNNIAKNTIFLYVRLLITLIVGVYTSRKILEILGVSDFGVYNVVGGVVVIISSLNGLFSSASQRFLSLELGKRNYRKIKELFSLLTLLYIIISVIFLIAAETVGLWFVNNILVIPAERLMVANYVYQFSVLSSIFTFLSIPYDSILVAYEKFNFFAYINILYSILKLSIVLILPYIDIDSLILYSLLLLLVTIIVRLINQFFCVKIIPESRYCFYFNKMEMISIFKYSSWNMCGVIANVSKEEGINILLNLFFGPIINASKGIASQLSSFLSQFVNNVNLSTRPPIVKKYAIKDYGTMWNITFYSIKFSFYIMMLMSMPLFFEIEFVLKLWLGNVPAYSSNFIRLILGNMLIECLFNQLYVPFQAANRLKQIQTLDFFLVLSVLPISYLLMKWVENPLIPFIIYIITSICRLIIITCISVKIMSLPLMKYGRLLLKCIWVFILTILSSKFISIIFNNTTFWDKCITIISIELISFIVLILVGLNDRERKYIISLIKK